MIIEQTQYELLPVGEYKAEITDVEPDEGNFGLQLKFTFAVQDKEGETHTLMGWTSARFSPKSKLYAWARAAFNADIPQDYNLNTDDLIGRPVKLTVLTRMKEDGSEFNRIEAVRPWRPEVKSANGLQSAPLFPGAPA